MNFLRLQILLCWIFTVSILYAQAPEYSSRKLTHIVGFDFRPSYVFPTNEFFKGANNAQQSINTTLSGHLKYGFKFTPDSEMGQLYPHAIQGIGIAYNRSSIRRSWEIRLQCMYFKHLE